MSDEIYEQWLAAGIVDTAPPPVMRVKVPRTEKEKKAALDEAKQRLARTGVGHAVDTGHSGTTEPEPEP